MPKNSSGLFQRLYNWVNDRDQDIDILAERHDAEDDGIVDFMNGIVKGEHDFKGPIKGVLGTAENPAYTFGDATDTGLYYSGGKVCLSVDGTKVAEFTIDGLSFDQLSDVPEATVDTNGIMKLGSTGGAARHEELQEARTELQEAHSQSVDTLASLLTAFSAEGKAPRVTDLNTIEGNRIVGFTTGATGAPASSGDGVVLQMAEHSQISQLCCLNSTSWYVRTNDASGATSMGDVNWKKILLDSNVSDAYDPSTIVERTSGGDVRARLFRSSFGTQGSIPDGAGLCFRADKDSDNYIRFCNLEGVRNWLIPPRKYVFFNYNRDSDGGQPILNIYKNTQSGIGVEIGLPSSPPGHGLSYVTIDKGSTNPFRIEIWTNRKNNYVSIHNSLFGSWKKLRHNQSTFSMIGEETVSLNFLDDGDDLISVYVAITEI